MAKKTASTLEETLEVFREGLVSPDRFEESTRTARNILIILGASLVFCGIVLTGLFVYTQNIIEPLFRW